MKLKGKTAIITGAGRGIGRAIAELFVEEGAAVVLNDVDEERVASAAGEIEAKRGKVVTATGDITQPRVASAIVERSVSAYGTVDILVNNAGTSKIVPFLETTEEIWDKTLRTNLTAVYLMCKAAVPVMLQHGGGTIINMSSLSAKQPTDCYAAYCASKAGLIGLTQSLAKEFSGQLIRVNAICPGIVATAMWEAMSGDYAKKKGIPVEEVEDYVTRRVPLRRLCTTKDVGELAVFLASDDSSYITGQAIPLCGGLFMS
jgi:NAD(P)-dependent dehydrogenase (short-subunit alcohol dehydrogenase family)